MLAWSALTVARWSREARQGSQQRDEVGMYVMRGARVCVHCHGGVARGCRPIGATTEHSLGIDGCGVGQRLAPVERVALRLCCRRGGQHDARGH